MSNEIELLQKQISELQDLVKKQSLIISKTGERVLELQVAKQKHDVSDFDSKFSKSISKKSGSAAQFDATDFATNEDLVELVKELQGELNFIEERSIRRLVNSLKKEDDDVIAPLPNADGDIPAISDGVFPKSLKEFGNISDLNLIRIAKFYERLPPTIKEQEDFENFLEGKVEAFHINETTDDEVSKELERFSKDELDDAFNDVARYLGLSLRRGTEIW
ncbi:mrp8p [Saccharomyces arboricola H-6]|uniref:Mrp8p n=1 Tax=Saccharomyces arboricola (strain H-6 / AS 2.3317 / CBS 10644) TaxID=1160507 RepID=J8PZY2_SACAR|nr:mrp8p [Saccharomyces arboricola H-6]